jgi:uncharacterized membrane protein required for colicin V production
MLVVITLSALHGALRGVIRAALALVGMVGALAIAGHLYPALGDVIHRYTRLPASGADWTAFLIVYAVSQAVISMVVAIAGLAGAFVPTGVLGGLAGGLLGAYRGMLIGAIVLAFVSSLPQTIRPRLGAVGPVSKRVFLIASPLLRELVPLLPGKHGEYVWYRPHDAMNM